MPAGALAVAACNLYPDMKATVVDLPHVIDLAQRHFTAAPYVRDPQLLQRVAWSGADFFADPDGVPPADVYVLSRILHDWEEAKCVQLLRLVHAKLPPGGALLVCEMLLSDDGAGPTPALLQVGTLTHLSDDDCAITSK